MERILHSSDIPATAAPRGFTTGTVNARVPRITVAVGGRADKDSDLLLTAASVANDGATLRVACFPEHGPRGAADGRPRRPPRRPQQYVLHRDPGGTILP